jgi:cyclin E
MKEPRIAVSPRIFEFNPELTPSMRCRLINWLIEVCLHFRLHRETLYLTIYFIDRYLSLTSNVLKKSLQLLGISALFVAAKLEVRRANLIA